MRTTFRLNILLPSPCYSKTFLTAYQSTRCHRTSQWNGYEVFFRIWSFQVQISPRKLAIGFSCFPQSLRANARKVPEVGHDRLLQLLFQMITYESCCTYVSWPTVVYAILCIRKRSLSQHMNRFSGYQFRLTCKPSSDVGSYTRQSTHTASAELQMFMEHWYLMGTARTEKYPCRINTTRWRKRTRTMWQSVSCIEYYNQNFWISQKLHTFKKSTVQARRVQNSQMNRQPLSFILFIFNTRL